MLRKCVGIGNVAKKKLKLVGAPVSLAQNSAAAESEGGQKFLPPNPSFLPARAFSLAREARHQFCSKNIRAELYNSTPPKNTSREVFFDGF